jgi:CobQ-like glutamine amidotransferase family enzyme
LRRLRLGHLFPELLNLYADTGNVAVLQSRAKWRGIEVTVKTVPLGTDIDFGDFDLLLLGGGSDREQEIVGRALLHYRNDFRRAVDDGLPVLAVCGGYQLLGRSYQLPSGREIEGLGIVDMVTRAGAPRLIGNIVIEDRQSGHTIVGYENHGGRTYHDEECLGRVLVGFGNNGKDGKEGICYRNVIGTYIHGPLLPKNPLLADRLLRMALRFSGQDDALDPLDDALEEMAHRTMVERLLAK